MTFPLPEITPLNEPFWDGLKAGKLLYQHCVSCGNAWLPARDACPACLSPEPQWRPSAGRAKLISWVVYHTAYHEAFKDRVPYVVACVELDEGPRLLTNLIDDVPPKRLAIDARLQLHIQTEGDLALARFRCAPALK